MRSLVVFIKRYTDVAATLRPDEAGESGGFISHHITSHAHRENVTKKYVIHDTSRVAGLCDVM